MEGTRQGIGAEIRAQWKKIALVGVAGLVAGFGAAAAASKARLTRFKSADVRHVSRASVGPGGATAPTRPPAVSTDDETERLAERVERDAKEISQLRAKNRRLEALVDVLRRRGETDNQKVPTDSGR